MTHDDLAAHAGPFARRAADIECPPDRVQTIRHPLHPRAERCCFRVETSAVVLDLEDEASVALGPAETVVERASAYFATFCIASSAQK